MHTTEYHCTFRPFDSTSSSYLLNKIPHVNVSEFLDLGSIEKTEGSVVTNLHKRTDRLTHLDPVIVFYT